MVPRNIPRNVIAGSKSSRSDKRWLAASVPVIIIRSGSTFRSTVSSLEDSVVATGTALTSAAKLLPSVGWTGVWNVLSSSGTWPGWGSTELLTASTLAWGIAFSCDISSDVFGNKQVLAMRPEQFFSLRSYLRACNCANLVSTCDITLQMVQHEHGMWLSTENASRPIVRPKVGARRIQHDTEQEGVFGNRFVYNKL